MVSWKLRCPKCGLELENMYRHRCPVCGSPLNLSVKDLDWKPGSVMGEGRTPLVERRINGKTVLFKLEYLNPSGSFKDRGTSINIHIARLLGYDCIVEDSSGNAGISAALYGAYTGMKTKIIVPRSAPQGKKKIIRSLGAQLILAKTRKAAAELAETLAGECYYIAHAWNPFFTLGLQSIAYEIAAKGYVGVPVIAPASTGGLIYALYQGFREYANRTPRIIAAQGSSNPWLAEAVGGTIEKGESTLADALVYEDPPRKEEAIKAIEKSGGTAVAVNDRSIKRAMKELWRMGFPVEPSSATAYAVYKKIAGKHIEGPAIIVLTGTGYKYLDAL